MADSFPGSSTDPFAEYDAAYVLGALSPEDRHAFEVHLKKCQACALAVQELAGIPGLLARADIVADEASDDPPATLLARLLTAVQRQRRRNRLLTGVGWLVAAACAVTLTLILALGGSATPAGTPPGGPTAAPGNTMRPVGGSTLTGSVSFDGVTWGTKIELKCTFPNGPAEYPTYKLVVVPKNTPEPQVVGTWKTVAGRTTTMNASSSIAAGEIDRFQVQTPAGKTVLELVLP
jgi:Putative zinc-finger